MEKEFIPYEQALELNKLGFDDECLAIYYKDDKHKKLLFSIEEKYSSNPEVAKHQARNTIRDINFDKGWAIKVPLYQQVFRWFKDRYKLFIQPNETKDVHGNWYYFYITGGKKRTYVTEGSFKYEEAELTCIKKLIEIVKSKYYDKK